MTESTEIFQLPDSNRDAAQAVAKQEDFARAIFERAMEKVDALGVIINIKYGKGYTRLEVGSLQYVFDKSSVSP